MASSSEACDPSRASLLVRLRTSAACIPHCTRALFPLSFTGQRHSRSPKRRAAQLAQLTSRLRWYSTCDHLDVGGGTGRHWAAPRWRLLWSTWPTSLLSLMDGEAIRTGVSSAGRPSLGSTHTSPGHWRGDLLGGHLRCVST